jgi:glycine/D-amino acid oxidase-like deaminating enzyme
MFWKPRVPEHFTVERLPVWMLVTPAYDIVYGFPDLGNGSKIAIQTDQIDFVDAETVDRSVTAADIDPVRREIERIAPDALGELLRAVVCMYTSTPDREFIVDAHPHHPNVLIACICNGQGFKYSSAFGEALSQLAVDGRTKLDISPWSIDRFTSSNVRELTTANTRPE